MAKRVGSRKKDDESALTRTVNSVFSFFRFAEFEILFVLFFIIAFIIFKDLVSTSSFSGSVRLPVHPFLLFQFPMDNMQVRKAEVPAPGEVVPAPGEEEGFIEENMQVRKVEVPAPGEDVPASGEDVPAPGEDVPASGEDVPASGEDVPAPGEEEDFIEDRVALVMKHASDLIFERSDFWGYEGFVEKAADLRRLLAAYVMPLKSRLGDAVFSAHDGTASYHPRDARCARQGRFFEMIDLISKFLLMFGGELEHILDLNKSALINWGMLDFEAEVFYEIEE